MATRRWLRFAGGDLHYHHDHNRRQLLQIRDCARPDSRRIQCVRTEDWRRDRHYWRDAIHLSVRTAGDAAPVGELCGARSCGGSRSDRAIRRRLTSRPSRRADGVCPGVDTKTTRRLLRWISSDQTSGSVLVRDCQRDRIVEVDDLFLTPEVNDAPEPVFFAWLSSFGHHHLGEIGNVVPFNQVWRTGANAATMFTTDKDLVFGSTVIPAGKYTLWTVPTPNGAQLIFNSETGQWGTDYHADKDFARVNLAQASASPPVEQFVIGVQPQGSGGVLSFAWDDRRWTAPFTVK